MKLDTFDKDNLESINPIAFFESLSKQENMPLSDVIMHFIRDYRDSTKNKDIKFTLNFYKYSRYTGFKKLSGNAFKESFCFLIGLSKNDEVKYETVPKDDHEQVFWYLRKESIERLSLGESTRYYYDPFLFRINEVVEYLKLKDISLPEYISSKLPNTNLDKDNKIDKNINTEKITDIDNKTDIPEATNQDSIETLTIEELKHEIAVAGQKYINLNKLLLNQLNLKEDHDLLKVTIEYRNKFWREYAEEKTRIKKFVHIEEIKSLTSLSNKKAEAIELISIPINRNPDKSKN